MGTGRGRYKVGRGEVVGRRHSDRKDSRLIQRGRSDKLGQEERQVGTGNRWLGRNWCWRYVIERGSSDKSAQEERTVGTRGRWLAGWQAGWERGPSVVVMVVAVVVVGTVALIGI